MIKLSVVIITLNEEKNLARCLNSVQEVADEIVIVDSFSTDKTREIAGSFNTKFLTHPFDGYVNQKNYANALNMMCAKARYLAMADTQETQRREKMKEANRYSVFEDLNIRIGKYDANNTESVITVLATGNYKVDVRFGEAMLSDDLKPRRWFVHVLLLKRIPVVNEENVFGLCVEEFIPKFIKTEEEYKKYLIDMSAKNRGAR